jgi:hypothetical protein
MAPGVFRPGSTPAHAHGGGRTDGLPTTRRRKARRAGPRRLQPARAVAKRPCLQRPTRGAALLDVLPGQRQPQVRHGNLAVPSVQRERDRIARTSTRSGAARYSVSQSASRQSVTPARSGRRDRPHPMRGNRRTACWTRNRLSLSSRVVILAPAWEARPCSGPSAGPRGSGRAHVRIRKQMRSDILSKLGPACTHNKACRSAARVRVYP